MSGPPFPRLFGKFSLLRPALPSPAATHVSTDSRASSRGGEALGSPDAYDPPGSRRPGCRAYLCAEPFAEQLRVLYIADIADLTDLTALAAGQPDGLADTTARLLAARQLCDLVHPHLISALEAGRVDDALFVACEYVPGRSLLAARDLCVASRQPLPLEAVLYIGRCVAAALHALHAHPLGARRLSTLSPAQIQLGVLGEVKLDAGLARRLLAPQFEPVQTGPEAERYLAPERTLAAAPSAAADVYALGAVLWELLAARRFPCPPSSTPPGSEAPPASEPEPEDIEAAAPLPEVPEVVAALIARALAPTPAERFPSAAALQAALDGALAALGHMSCDAGCVVTLLRALWGDQIAHELDEQAWLLDAAFRGRRRVGAGPASGTATPSSLPGSGGAALLGSGPQGPLASGAASTSAPSGTSPAPPVVTPPSSPEARLRRGEVIDGRYRLRRLIGVGGMGAVYEAEHVSIGKRVALKILHPQFSRHPELVERLRREAQAASRVGHPNIVDVSDFGRTEDGSAYLAMEYLSGTDLGAVRRARGRIPEERALHIGVQLVRALGAAHRAGVVHRDLKPENVFLVNPTDPTDLAFAPDWSPRGEASHRQPEPGEPGSPPDGPAPTGQDLVKVLDFGVAMQLEAGPTGPGTGPRPQARLTTPGLTVGTPEYMAPEQAMGLAVDARVDIYAVGALLYEMLTGRVPLVAASVPEILRLKTTSDPPPPRHWMPSLSPQVEAAVMACLRRDPLTRPQSMEELERALLAAATELGIVIDPGLPGAVRASAASGRLRLPASTLRPMPALALSPPPSGLASPPRVAEPIAQASAGPIAKTGAEPIAQASAGPVVAPSGAEPGAPSAALVAGSRAGSLVEPARKPGAPPAAAGRRARWIAATSLVLIGVGFFGARLFTRRSGSPEPAALPSTTAAVRVSPPDASRPGAGEPRPARLDETGETSDLLQRAEQALAAGHFVEPAQDSLAHWLAALEQRAPLAEPVASAVKRLRQRAGVQLVGAARAALAQKRPLEALALLRGLPSVAPAPAKGVDPGAQFPRAELSRALLAEARRPRPGRPGADPLLLLRAAVEAEPTSAAAQLALAEALRKRGQRDEAMALYRRVLTLGKGGEGSRARPAERRVAERSLRRLAEARPRRPG
jgi:serine/threonine-protein kinase